MLSLLIRFTSAAMGCREQTGLDSESKDFDVTIWLEIRRRLWLNLSVGNPLKVTK